MIRSASTCHPFSLFDQLSTLTPRRGLTFGVTFLFAVVFFLAVVFFFAEAFFFVFFLAAMPPRLRQPAHLGQRPPLPLRAPELRDAPVGVDDRDQLEGEERAREEATDHRSCN